MKYLLAIITTAAMLAFYPQADYRNNSKPSVKLPILMYHNIIDGKKSKYTVSPSVLEADIIMLKNNGFTAVYPSQIISYVYSGKSLPKKPVLLTFDDGHYNNMHHALPLLKKHGFVAVFNIVGAFSQYSTKSGDHSNISYSHMTWSQIKEAQDSKVVEIGSHTYNMHTYKPRFGISKLFSESQELYGNSLSGDILLMQEKLTACGVPKPEVFAYPFGEYNDFAEKVLIEHGFKLMLTCNFGVSTVEKDKPQTLYRLKRINREPTYSSSELLKIISN